MSSTVLLLIGLILLVLLLMYYYTRRSRAPIEVSGDSVEIKSKPRPKSIPRPRRVQVRLDPVNISTTEGIMLRTKEDLVKEIEKVVETKIEKKNEMANEIGKMESREIHSRKEKTEIIKAETEEVLGEKTREIVNATSAIEELIQKRRNELLKKKKKQQEDEVARLLIQKERTAAENAKKLADIKLARRNALKKMEEAEKSRSQLEVKTREQELLRLEEARGDVEAKKVELEAEAKNLKEQVESNNRQLEIDEALFQEEKVKLLEEHKKLETEYIELEAERLEKIKEAEAELSELVESEKNRQVQMEADDERLRQIETQKLLEANEDALKELEEAEAEQERMDKEREDAEAAMSDILLEQELKQRRERDEDVQRSEEEELAAQIEQDLLQQASRNTGDADQQAERDAALALELSSESDWADLTAAEQQAAIDARAQLDADSTTAAADYGENPALLFDYAAYERGDPMDCIPGEWSKWEKKGEIQEETETIVTHGPFGCATTGNCVERPTGRWKQTYQRTQTPLSPAMNGGKACPYNEFKSVVQVSKDCDEDDWNPWTDVGKSYFKAGAGARGYGAYLLDQKRTRATEVDPGGCNLREDTRTIQGQKRPCTVNWGNWVGVGPVTEHKKLDPNWRPGPSSLPQGYVGTGKFYQKEQRTGTIVDVGTEAGRCPTTETRTVDRGPEDCKLSGWTGYSFERNWNSGNNHYSRKKRTKSIIAQPKYGGAACGATTDYRDDPIPKIHCKVGSYGGWHNGYTGHTRRRAYTCVHTRGGVRCGHYGKLQILRNDKRTRSITTHPKWGGNGCPGLVDTRETNITPPPAPPPPPPPPPAHRPSKPKVTAGHGGGK